MKNGTHMTNTTLRLFTVIGLNFMLAVFGFTENQTELNAYNNGDYETAFKKFLPLAEQGDVIAQTHLGEMYTQGRGVPQDNQEARQWYRLAAEQGFASATVQPGSIAR